MSWEEGGNIYLYIYIFPTNTIIMCDQCLILLIAPPFPVTNSLQIIEDPLKQ